MAKKNMVAREKKRLTLAANETRKAKREEYKKIIKDSDASYDEKKKARNQLSKRKRDESPSRSNTRCERCGRVHAVLKKFRLCRICVRKCAERCLMPGVRKSSW